MKASMLVRRLKEVIAHRGDLPVAVLIDGARDYRQATKGVTVSHDGRSIFVHILEEELTKYTPADEVSA